MADRSELVTQALQVLKNNDHGSFTMPAGKLYPHQWLWDSCFTAIGIRHASVDRAQLELTSLLRGQWSNGMLPNMIFDSSFRYSQDRNIWRSQLSVFAPDEVSTTGITQPPMLAEAVLQVGKKLKKPERRTWYQTMYPALLAYHQWLYRERDPKDSGLTLQLHPYETGLDSTPPWINQLHKHHMPWWGSVLESTRLVRLVELVRRDTRHVPPGQRMSNMDALLYYDVIRKLRAKRYDTKKILKKSQFAIQDLTFNCILIRANECLEEIASTIMADLPAELTARMAKSRLVLEQLWDGYSSQYYSRNQATNKLIREPSIATLLPLYAGCITPERAEQLVGMLDNEAMFATPFPVPSVPKNSKYFDPLRYWQGPSWVNTNWLIIQGLERYGYTKEAAKLRKTTLEMVKTSGFYEYFSPLDGTPAGAQNFSWTAALVIDLSVG